MSSLNAGIRIKGKCEYWTSIDPRGIVKIYCRKKSKKYLMSEGNESGKVAHEEYCREHADLMLAPNDDGTETTYKEISQQDYANWMKIKQVMSS